MRVVITGATGMLGRRLAAGFDPDAVTVLTRDVDAARRHVRAARYVAWDGLSTIPADVFEGVDVVYHLAGEPVASGRWSAEKKRHILESRQLGTRAVVDGLARASSRAALVSASAVGFYGSRGDERLTEESAAGHGFLPDVCRLWEAEAARAGRAGSRVAMLRIGIVLGRDGGMLAKTLPLFRLGLGGRLGDGKQWMPWIHVDDVVGLLRRAGESEALDGPINACAPNAVRNDAFTEELAHVLRRPAMVAAPAWAIRALFGELGDVVLASQNVLPERATRSGFVFRYPELSGALLEIAGEGAPAPREVVT